MVRNSCNGQICVENAQDMEVAVTADRSEIDTVAVCVIFDGPALPTVGRFRRRGVQDEEGYWMAKNDEKEPA